MTSPEDTPAGGSAGAMLKAARERQGLHIAALAASIKVAPAKLDALENDRYTELPDATFTRALAQSVCRVLKIDAKPVLDKLPSSVGAVLEKVDAGLNTPFRDKAAVGLDPAEWMVWRQPLFWVVLAMLGAAAAFWLWPVRGIDWPTLPGGGATAPVTQGAAPAVTAGTAPAAPGVPAVAPEAAGAQPAAAPPGGPVVETVHSVPAPVAGASGTEASDLPATMLVLRTDEASWVEVQDARNLVLFSRTLQPGETVGLDGTPPLKLKIGNAAATQVQFKGEAVDVASRARDNVARFELK